jgi:hypothetical protein
METPTDPRDPSQPEPPTTTESDPVVEREDEKVDSEPTTSDGPTGLDAIDEDLARKNRENERVETS